jgi:hypothetical protein
MRRTDRDIDGASERRVHVNDGCTDDNDYGRSRDRC